MDALYAEGEVQGGIERKLSKQKKIMDIVDIVMQVLKSENWGVYYKNRPMKHLGLQDGNSFYQVNQVDESDVESTIEHALTKGSSWEHSQTDLNQKKNSETG